MRKCTRGKKNVLCADSNCSINVRSSHFLNTVYLMQPHLLREMFQWCLEKGEVGKAGGSCQRKAHGSTREPGPKESQFRMHRGQDKAERFSVNGKNRTGRCHSSSRGMRAPWPRAGWPILAGIRPWVGTLGVRWRECKSCVHGPCSWREVKGECLGGFEGCRDSGQMLFRRKPCLIG